MPIARIHRDSYCHTKMKHRAKMGQDKQENPLKDQPEVEKRATSTNTGIPNTDVVRPSALGTLAFASYFLPTWW